MQPHPNQAEKKTLKKVNKKLDKTEKRLYLCKVIERDDKKLLQRFGELKNSLYLCHNKGCNHIQIKLKKTLKKVNKKLDKMGKRLYLCKVIERDDKKLPAPA